MISEKTKVMINEKPRKIKARYIVLLMLWLGWMFSFLDRMIMNVSLPFIGKELHLDKTEQGWIISAFFIGYALFQIPGGWLADKFGARKVMTVAILWWSIFTSLTGFILSYPLMLIVRFLFGVGEGCFPGTSWKTISTYFPAKERGFATSIQSSVNTLGPALAIFVAAAIIGKFGWHTVFIVLGIPGLLVGIGMYYFCRDDPADNPMMTQHELNELDYQQTDTNATQETVSLASILKSPLLWKLTAIWFFFDITFWGFMTWLPSYLMEVRGLSLSSTGTLAAIPFLFGALGTLSGGYFSDKNKSQRKILYVVTSILSAGTLYMVYTVDAISHAIIYQCLSALFMFFAMALFWGMIMDYFPAKIMGRSSSIINFGGQVAGVIAPPVIGWLIGAYNNYDNGFIFMIVALVISALVTLTVSKNARFS